MALPPAYSVVIARFNSVPVSGGVVVGPPPTGYKWVVVDMTAYTTGIPWTALNGLVVEDDDGAALWAITTPEAVQGRYYHWRGRQVIEAGQNLVILAGEASWQLRISGFKLQVA